jgi:hypothetical protein
VTVVDGGLEELANAGDYGQELMRSGGKGVMRTKSFPSLELFLFGGQQD